MSEDITTPPKAENVTSPLKTQRKRADSSQVSLISLTWDFATDYFTVVAGRSAYAF